MNKWLGAGAMVLGLILFVLGAQSMLEERRYSRALADLNALLWGPSGDQKSLPQASEQFVFRDSVRAGPVADLEIMRDTVPEDEIQRPALAAPNVGDKYVRPAGASTQGDGSAESPWSGLQHALNQILPGERLVVLGGFYNGPFLIGSSASSGTAENPITVFFASNALLQGGQRPRSCDHAVLSVEQSHWTLSGLTVTPQYCPTALQIGATAQHVSVEQPHLFGGVGSGISVAAQARNIMIYEPHLHHLGSLEGKDKETKAAQRLSAETPESSLIPALELPAAGAVVHGGKVHNHFGPLIVLLAPDGTRLPSETALSQLDAWDVSYKEGQAQWW